MFDGLANYLNRYRRLIMTGLTTYLWVYVSTNILFFTCKVYFLSCTFISSTWPAVKTYRTVSVWKGLNLSWLHRIGSFSVLFTPIIPLPPSTCLSTLLTNTCTTWAVDISLTFYHLFVLAVFFSLLSSQWSCPNKKNGNSVYALRNLRWLVTETTVQTTSCRLLPMVCLVGWFPWEVLHCSYVTGIQSYPPNLDPSAFALII